SSGGAPAFPQSSRCRRRPAWCSTTSRGWGMQPPLACPLTPCPACDGGTVAGCVVRDRALSLGPDLRRRGVAGPARVGAGAWRGRRRVGGGERVPLSAAVGRIAAADITPARAVPAAANSAMDGFAVRAEDVATAPARLRLIGMAPAGTLLDTAVVPGTAAKIFTGSVVPDGADTVVRVE